MSRELMVRVADLKAGSGEDILVTLGLGSCVAILLFDNESKVGGLAHILLPSRSLSRGTENPAKFPQSAVPALVAEMSLLGAIPGRLTARLVGGASMFAGLAPPGSIQMGERNLVATREVLNSQGIPVIGESVGGDFGRSVRFHVRLNRIEIKSVAHGEQLL
ncbi:MAG: chemotaxis protein CheD [Gemmatimonadota bacterium]